MEPYHGVGVLVGLGVRVMVGVRVRVLVLVAVGVRVGSINPVFVGCCVMVGMTWDWAAVAVHVGGNGISVAVEVGISTVGGNVGNLNGLIPALGFVKMEIITITTITQINKIAPVMIFQVDVFISTSQYRQKGRCVKQPVKQKPAAKTCML